LRVRRLLMELLESRGNGSSGAPLNVWVCLALSQAGYVVEAYAEYLRKIGRHHQAGSMLVPLNLSDVTGMHADAFAYVCKRHASIGTKFPDALADGFIHGRTVSISTPWW
jgi:hypothetical protein